MTTRACETSTGTQPQTLPIPRRTASGLSAYHYGRLPPVQTILQHQEPSTQTESHAHTPHVTIDRECAQLLGPLGLFLPDCDYHVLRGPRIVELVQTVSTYAQFVSPESRQLFSSLKPEEIVRNNATLKQFLHSVHTYSTLQLFLHFPAVAQKLAALPPMSTAQSVEYIKRLIENQSFIDCCDQLVVPFSSSSGIAIIPPLLGKMTHMTTLTLVCPHIKTLHPSIFLQLLQLQTVSLTLNFLRIIPQSIGRLANVRSITIESLQLNEIPHEIALLHHCERMHITAPISCLPAITLPASLRVFYLNSPLLNRIPEAFFPRNLRPTLVCPNVASLPDSIFAEPTPLPEPRTQPTLAKSEMVLLRTRRSSCPPPGFPRINFGIPDQVMQEQQGKNEFLT